jgi:hypothetical protein
MIVSMDRSRDQRIDEIKREMAILRTEERRLTFVSTSQKQPMAAKDKAAHDLVEVRDKLSRFADGLKELEG